MHMKSIQQSRSTAERPAFSIYNLPEKILPHLESDRIRKPSLYNKEFDRRTADVILGFCKTSLFPREGKEKEHHSTLCDQGVSSRFDLVVNAALNSTNALTHERKDKSEDMQHKPEIGCRL
jgi:hypothetical protein